MYPEFEKSVVPVCYRGKAEQLKKEGMLQHKTKKLDFYPFFQPHPGHVFTFREIVRGETDQAINLNQGNQMSKRMVGVNLDGLEPVDHARLLGNEAFAQSVGPKMSCQSKLVMLALFVGAALIMAGLYHFVLTPRTEGLIHQAQH